METGRKPIPRAESGLLDLRSWNFAKDGPIDLKGIWKFYPMQFPVPGQNQTGRGSYISMPGYWNGMQIGNRLLADHGYAGYRLRVLMPLQKSPNSLLALRIFGFNTSHRLYVNGRLISSAGKAGRTAAETIPQSRSGVFLLSRTSSDAKEINIDLHIANYHHKDSGAYRAPQIGSAKSLFSRRERKMNLDMLLFGAALIMGLFQLGLFVVLRSNPSSLYFGIVCLLIGFRSLSLDERLILSFIPDFPWELQYKMSYGFYFAGIPFAVHLVRSLYPKELISIVARVVTYIFSLAALTVLFSSAIVYSYLLLPMQVLTILAILYCLYAISLASYRKRDGSILFLSGFVPLLVSVTNDILYNNRVIDTGNFAGLGLFAMILSQSVVIARRIGGAYKKTEELSESLIRENTVMSRFVPNEFLHLLGRSDITEVRLNDQTRAEMAILFADIRSYTSLSETMSPEENFTFLNNYLRRVGPYIRLHNGFIHQYYGDGILALFPTNADDAVHASIEMQRKISEYNIIRDEMGRKPISVGIGLHSGKLLLGIIGEESRMENGIVSQAVNRCTRIERLTRIFGADILMSKDVLMRLPQPDLFRYRLIAAISEKGGKEDSYITEIFHDVSDPVTRLKLETKDDFEKGIVLFQSGEFADASLHFKNVISVNPNDIAARYYESHSVYHAEHGIPPDWSGFVAEDMK